jgi:D-isomer specific 2-hydroxyacid dehydrogenase, NAD binding domain
VRVVATRRYPGAAFDELDEVEIRALAELVAPLPNVEGLIVSNEPVPLGCYRDSGSSPTSASATTEWALDTLLGESDIVTLHVPLTPQTDGLIDARRLALIRDGSCLVNTARGEVVDEDASSRSSFRAGSVPGSTSSPMSLACHRSCSSSRTSC